jgi:hypothetical protein
LKIIFGCNNKKKRKRKKSRNSPFMSSLSIIEDLFVLKRFEEAIDVCKHFIKEMPMNHFETVLFIPLIFYFSHKCTSPNCACTYLIRFLLSSAALSGRSEEELEGALLEHYKEIKDVPFVVFSCLYF